MRHTHYKPIGHELTNWEWCGTRMSLDSFNTDTKGHVTCGRCLKKMGSKAPARQPKPRSDMEPISRAAGRLIRLMDDLGKERYTVIDSFVGEKPHAMVIVANTPEHCAKIMKQLKRWLALPKKGKKS